MDSPERIALGVIIGTVLVLAMIVFVALLLVVNAGRRHRHRAELSRLQLLRDQEVMRAEREAVQHTLNEVGRDLHDNVGQLFTVVQMGLEHMSAEPGADPRNATLRDTVEQGIGELRRLGRSLNMDLWKERSLEDALEAEAARVGHVAGIRTVVRQHGDPPALPADDKTILFRVFQEILSNAVRHAKASLIEIDLHGGDAIELTIRDNGRGFDPETTRGNGGLVNIRRRCELIGFDARCVSSAGGGCEWRLRRG
jgi:two-component system, NarL family, sensor kinase